MTSNSTREVTLARNPKRNSSNLPSLSRMPNGRVRDPCYTSHSHIAGPTLSPRLNNSLCLLHSELNPRILETKAMRLDPRHLTSRIPAWRMGRSVKTVRRPVRRIIPRHLHRSATHGRTPNSHLGSKLDPRCTASTPRGRQYQS